MVAALTSEMCYRVHALFLAMLKTNTRKYRNMLCMSYNSAQTAVTTDLWAEERTNTHYITVMIHYILGWNLFNWVLATREILGIKTHENIRMTVESILQEFGILSKDIVVVTDNGSNVVTAFKDYTRLSCAGHNINLILKYTFDRLDVENPKHSPIINLFRDVKTLVTHFKRAGLQKALDRSLKQAVETRWNTRLGMLQSLRDALQSEAPPLVATGTEVHSFFSSCVQVEKREKHSNTVTEPRFGAEIYEQAYKYDQRQPVPSQLLAEYVR